jgi:hypothetical protein
MMQILESNQLKYIMFGDILQLQIILKQRKAEPRILVVFFVKNTCGPGAAGPGNGLRRPRRRGARRCSAPRRASANPGVPVPTSLPPGPPPPPRRPEAPDSPARPAHQPRAAGGGCHAALLGLAERPGRGDAAAAGEPRRRQPGGRGADPPPHPPPPSASVPALRSPRPTYAHTHHAHILIRPSAI